MKKYSIEAKAMRTWGTTNLPELCVWLTKEGAMINGSYEGNQRDRDHREIAGFYKRSKFESPGSSWVYIKKFMKRGNIRVGCSKCGYYLEIWGTPTEAQLYIINLFHEAASEENIEFGIGKRDTKDFSKVTMYDFYGYLHFLKRYTRLKDLGRHGNAA